MQWNINHKLFLHWQAGFANLFYHICQYWMKQYKTWAIVANSKTFSKGVDLTYNYMNRWQTVTWTDDFDCEGKIVKISSLHWCIYNQHDDHLPVGLSAQLVKHCLGIAEAMGSNPIPARIFFKIYFCYCLIIVCYCKNSSHIHRCFCIVNPGVKLLLFWYLRIRELMHQDVLSL